MALFQLPQDLAQYVLNDWLNDAKSISALDVACSSTDELREEFLHLIRHPQFVLQPVMEPVERCPAFIRWLSVRKVKTAMLVVDAERLADIAAITFLRLPSVTTLRVIRFGTSGVAADPEHLAYLLKRCPALTCVNVEEGDDSDTVIHGLLLVPTMPLCSLLVDECFGLKESTIRSLAFCFRHTLRVLEVGGALLTDSALDFIGLACPNLVTVHLRGDTLSRDAVSRFCAVVGGRLTNFSLEYFSISPPIAGDQQDDFMCHLADKLPLVESLRVPDLSHTTWRSLQYVLDHCPNICYAQASWVFDLKTSANTIKSCRLCFSSISAQDVFTFMTSLPHKLTAIELENCGEQTCDVVAPFVDKHGSTIERLHVDRFAAQAPDGLIMLLNGCINVRDVCLSDWQELNQEIATKLFPGGHLHLTSLCIFSSSQLDDIALAILLDKCSVLSSLYISKSPLVTDSSLDVIARRTATLRNWSFNSTSITTTGVIKLVLHYPACPFDSVCVGSEISMRNDLRILLLAMGEVGQQWIKTLGV